MRGRWVRDRGTFMGAAAWHAHLCGQCLRQSSLWQRETRGTEKSWDRLQKKRDDEDIRVDGERREAVCCEIVWKRRGNLRESDREGGISFLKCRITWKHQACSAGAVRANCQEDMWLSSWPLLASPITTTSKNHSPPHFSHSLTWWWCYNIFLLIVSMKQWRHTFANWKQGTEKAESLPYSHTRPNIKSTTVLILLTK